MFDRFLSYDKFVSMVLVSYYASSYYLKKKSVLYIFSQLHEVMSNVHDLNQKINDSGLTVRRLSQMLSRKPLTVGSEDSAVHKQ